MQLITFKQAVHTAADVGQRYHSLLEKDFPS